VFVWYGFTIVLLWYGFTIVLLWYGFTIVLFWYGFTIVLLTKKNNSKTKPNKTIVKPYQTKQ
jgi:hypothetical protein